MCKWVGSGAQYGPAKHHSMLVYSAPSLVTGGTVRVWAPSPVSATVATTPLPTPDEDRAPTAAEGQAAQAAHVALAQALLDAALQAQRTGTLADLVRQRPRAARWMLRRHTRLMVGTAGDALPAERLPQLALWMLRWLVTQLRPDAGPDFNTIHEDAWLRLSGWRPVLVMASYAGFVQVPDFPRVYRRHSGEAALDNLCGLWGVGPSTLYRMLDRARQTMAQTLLDDAPDAVRRLSLRQLVTDQCHLLQQGSSEALRQGWHQRQARSAQALRDPASQLWHCWQAGDVAAFVECLRRHAGALASEPDVQAMVERVAALDLQPRTMVDLCLARAALARTRNQADRELRAYERALQVAQAADSPLLLGIVHSALGKYFEPRDADRAFACYQDSADFLRGLDVDSEDTATLEHAVTTLARLAWLYLQRNDARSKAVLDRAEDLCTRFRVPDDAQGMLEQVWGEYWRRAGDLPRSIEHRYRALNIFERLGDERSVLATQLNLVPVLGERGDYTKAVACAQRIFDAARVRVVEPALLASTHLNLGTVHFWRGDTNAALVQYQAALDQSLQAGLRLHTFRAHYNLAEAFYVRCRDTGHLDDERQGDAHVQQALAAPESDSSPSAIESARKLKEEVLGARRVAEPERLLSGDTAVHFEELALVQRKRQLLAVPAAARQHAEAHLAIATAYAAIAAKEREAAQALIEREGLQTEFVHALEALQQTFERRLTHEQQLAARWKQLAAEVLDDTRRAALISQLLSDGKINKSTYASLGDVSPATASKHLGVLASRGLLVQQGMGPATHYTLPP